MATSTSIKDEVATAFADRFYRALASSSTIADAFRQASGAVKATISTRAGATYLEHEAIRAVTRDVVPPDQDGSPLEWPWGLYGSDAATAATLIGTVHKGWPSIYAVLGIAALVTGYTIYRNATGSDKPAAMPSTLWLQVTKNESAPWQEVAMPATSAPSVPATMPNRFDVLENGRFTRFADGYRDLWDPRDDELAQRTNAHAELERILIDSSFTARFRQIARLSVQPGAILTELRRWMSEDAQRAMIDVASKLPAGFKTTEQGAATSVWCATSPQLDGLGGVSCENANIAQPCRPTCPSRAACDHGRWIEISPSSGGGDPSSGPASR